MHWWLLVGDLGKREEVKVKWCSPPLPLGQKRRHQFLLVEDYVASGSFCTKVNEYCKGKM